MYSYIVLYEKNIENWWANLYIVTPLWITLRVSPRDVYSFAHWFIHPFILMLPLSDMLFSKLIHFVLDRFMFFWSQEIAHWSFCATIKTHALKIELFEFLCSSGKKNVLEKTERGVVMSWLFSLVGLSSCSVSGFLSLLLVQRTFL